MLRRTLEFDELGLNCSGLIGPRSESSSSSAIVSDDRVNIFRLDAGDDSSANNFFFRSEIFGDGSWRLRVLLLVLGVLSI